MEAEPQVFDVTARKVHQWTMVLLVVLAYLVPAAHWLLLLAGLVMVAGRFFWPLDLVRQFTWRVLEPARIVPRVDRVEDHETRRVARVLGGWVWIVSALLVAWGAPAVGFILAGLIAVMVALDAAVDFCALCFLSAQLEVRRSKG